MLAKIIMAFFLGTTPAIAVEPLEITPTIEQRIELRATAYNLSPELALKIATCESSLRQFDDDGEVLRGYVNSKDVGLFQINEKYHLEKSQEMELNIYTEDGNIEYAMWLMSEEGTKPWNWSKSCWGN